MPKHVRNIFFLILTLLTFSYSKGENIVNKALPIHSQQDSLNNPSNNKNTIVVFYFQRRKYDSKS